jgi:hypothetical protein
MNETEQILMKIIYRQLVIIPAEFREMFLV